MKRSAIHRKTPLRAKESSKLVRRERLERRSTIGHGAQAKSKLPAVNPANQKAAHMRNFDGGIDHDRHICSLPCVWCDLEGIEQQSITQPAHIIARGMGGCNGAWFDQCPLCEHHHRAQEAKRFTEAVPSREFLLIIARRNAVQHLAARLSVKIEIIEERQAG